MAIEKEITHLELELGRMSDFVGALSEEKKTVDKTLFETKVLNPTLQKLGQGFKAAPVNPSTIENELKPEFKAKGAVASIKNMVKSLTESEDDDIQAWKISNETITAYALLVYRQNHVDVCIIGSDTLTNHLISHKELEMKQLWEHGKTPASDAEYEIYINGVIQLFNEHSTETQCPPPPDITGI